MTSGIKLVLASAFTDLTLPILYDDAILSKGSLFLHDPAHSTQPITTLPTNGSSIPNIAYKPAIALLGSGSITSLMSTFTDNHLSADAFFELSGKGGIHGCYSQTNNTNSNRGARIQVASALQTYLYANPANAFYFSIWGRRTRAAITTSQQPRKASIGDSGTIKITFDALATTIAGSLGSTQVNSPNSLGNFFEAGAGVGWITNPANAAAVIAQPYIWGNIGSGGAAWNNFAASDILYRSYLEDLTVSGRTFSQVAAIDQALWTTAMAAGGRYYGDTFTAPSTFP